MKRLSCPDQSWLGRKNQSGSKKLSKLMLGVLCLLTLSLLSQFISSNVLALGGVQVVKSSSKIASLSRENQQLREELASEMSITKISNNAKSQGLSVVGTLKYYDLSEPVAILPQ